jgi:pectate lyase
VKNFVIVLAMRASFIIFVANLENDMKNILSILFLLGAALLVQAQRVEHSLVGFAAMPGYGLEGTIGGGLGEVVRVTDEADLRRYCAAEGPYTILFDGTIKASDEHDIDVASDKTIIGLGGRAVLDGIGFRAEGVSNVVIRGFTIRNAHQDAIAFRSSHHVWVDHCDLGSSDDGLLDFTIGSDLLTASWNRFLDHNKVSVCNSGTQHAEDVGRENVSYHHNAFLRTTQRNPRIGYGRGHVWNNYYEGVKSYCVGYFCGARVVVEGNSFNRCKTPLKQMYSDDPASAFYACASSVDNLFNECSGNTQGTGAVFDAGSLYDYTMALDKAADVQARVTASAGPVAGLEYDLIPLPNHGRTDFAPADGTLRWSKAPDAVEYQVYLSTSPTIRPGDRVGRVNDNQITLKRLKAATRYYWRVDTRLADTLLTGAVWQFTTASAFASKPFPADGEGQAPLHVAQGVEATQPLVLQWSPAFGAKGYRLTLSDEKGEVVRTAEVDASTTTWQPEALPYGRSYTWSVTPVMKRKTAREVPQWTFSTPIAEAREGMNEAEVWTRGLRSFVEVQDGAWFKASGDKVVCGEAGVGTLSAEWRGGRVKADISLRMFDESDGKGCYRLYINNVLQRTLIADANTDALVNHPLGTFDLNTGDQLRLELLPEGGESCRTDGILITVR